jgi:protocatechuate 3,4-dioxygenase beta subunit
VYATTSTAASPVVTLPPGDRGTRRLVLAPSSIAGTVVDTRGAPVAGATVWVRGQHDRYGGDTDARGRFDVGGVLPGAYQLTVVHGKHVHEPLPEMTVTAGDHGVALVVPALAAIAGRVVAEGKPVPRFGIVVTTMAESLGGERPTVIHDAEGRFVVPGLDRGEDRVTIVAPGFVPRTVEHVELAAGATSALGDIALDRGRAIAGRIVDDHGAPVAGATVTVYEKRERSSTDDGFLGMLAGTRSVRTGRGGRYRLEGIPPTQTAWRIEATHASGRASVDRALAIDETEVDLAVVPTGGILGSLAQAARSSSETLVIARSVSDPASYHQAEIHATGAFRFDHLPPGEYELDAPEPAGVPYGRATVVAGARVRVVLTASSQSR